MKKLLSVGILILLLAGIPAANAQPLALPPDVEHNGSVWTIYPHNSSPDDPQRIREVVALAASAAFMTPVSSPVNTLIVEPGRYRFSDFLKLGTPFTILVMIVVAIMVPLVMPLHP